MTLGYRRHADVRKEAARVNEQILGMRFSYIRRNCFRVEGNHMRSTMSLSISFCDLFFPYLLGSWFPACRPVFYCASRGMDRSALRVHTLLEDDVPLTIDSFVAPTPKPATTERYVNRSTPPRSLSRPGEINHSAPLRGGTQRPMECARTGSLYCISICWATGTK
jgi:hypothetical protein